MTSAALASAISSDYNAADLTDADKALCAWAIKLTKDCSSAGGQDVELLRKHGFSDAETSHAAQVVSYFNYINRIAEGLGVDLEPEWAQNISNSEND